MQVRYHEWLKRKHSEENTCTCCGQRVFPGSGLITSKHIGRSTVQLMFCTDQCHQDFYMENLQRTGFEAAPCDLDLWH